MKSTTGTGRGGERKWIVPQRPGSWLRGASDCSGEEVFSVLNALKRFLVGQPLRTSQAIHERLSKRVALAVFASDALSSVAYATEEILLVLAMAAAYVHDSGPFFYVLPISLVIAVLLWLV